MEDIDIKPLRLLKLTVKKMLIAASKYGISKEKDTTAQLYFYTNEDFTQVYPVVMINHENNPWGDKFYPPKLFLIPPTLNEEDVNLFDNTKMLNGNEVKGLRISRSYKINIAEFKKYIPTIKELQYDITDGVVDFKFDGVLSSSVANEFDYVDVFYNIPSLRDLIQNQFFKFKTIDDTVELTNIYGKLSENSTHEVPIDDTDSLRIFYITCPIVATKLEFTRHLHIRDNDVTSTVYMKQHSSNYVIHNFYNYVDIWNIVTPTKKG